MIEQTLRELCDQEKCCLVVTTGGTGPARRDVTPEATEAVCDKLLDGFGEQMRAVSLKVVPTAILSRQIAGIRGQSLIVNLPGKPSAIRDCLLAVFPAIPYCIDLDRGAVPDDERGGGQGLPAEGVAAEPPGRDRDQPVVGIDLRRDFGDDQMRSLMTCPCTSVSRRSMPLWRTVSRSWSMPSRCSIVAWTS